MKKIVRLSTLICTVLLISCHQKPMAASGNGTNAAAATSTEKQTNTVKEVTVNPQADLSATGAAYNVDSISISGDVLSVFVNYSGGCKEHSFELLSNGMYAKSMPPQISVVLKHTNNDDNCRKLVMQELKFNVAALKYKGGNATVIKMGDRKVTYAAVQK